MDYKNLANLYEQLSKTSKRLEKTKILAELLKETKTEEVQVILLLLSGRVFPEWSEQKIGVAARYVIKALAVSTGNTREKIEAEWKKTGDLGQVAENFIGKKKQVTLFSHTLSVIKVFSNLQKLATITGEGTMEQKVKLLAELLTSASPSEAKYIVRTALEEMRLGIGAGTVRDAIAWSCFPNFSPPTDIAAREVYNLLIIALDHAYSITNDFAKVIEIARKKGYKGLLEIDIELFSPIQVMLFQKAKDIDDAFSIIGKPAAFEYKYDGFRIQCHIAKDNIKLYTRNFEEVTKQFPDVVEAIKKHVSCESCIFDSEIVGYNPKTTQYVAFQEISQRIKRKYDIEKIIKKLPVEINVFDILYYNGKSVIDKQFHERRAILSKIIHPKDRVIVLSRIIVTDKKEEAIKFYNEALDKGNEGVMVKNLAAVYKPGSRVGFGVKVKPVMESLDVVIVGAEWGEGKRVSWMTSFVIAVRNDENDLVEIGRVGTGIKELEGEGVTFDYFTKALKDYVVEGKGKEVKIKPRLVIEVHYEEIQKSPTYSSGYALRFPRFIRLREDRGIHNCSTLEQVEELYKEQRGRGK